MLGEGLDGLEDLPRSGAPPIYGEVTDKRIRAVLDEPPPAGFARWNGPLIAEALGDVDVQYVWRSLRKQKIDLGGRKSWCESKDPEFAAKAADVVGLYLAPPRNAVVLCVDEKPSIQALERAQGYLKLPNGRALTGHSHDYKRNGTTTLFAAFEVTTGKVRAAHKKRRRRKEFLDFMDDVVAAYPKRRLESSSTTVNANVASKVIRSEGRARNRRGEGSMGCRNLTDAALPPRRGGSDSTVTRTHRGTGEALLVPVRNHRSKVGRITG